MTADEFFERLKLMGYHLTSMECGYSSLSVRSTEVKVDMYSSVGSHLVITAGSFEAVLAELPQREMEDDGK